IHFAHAAADAALDFLDRHAVGLLDVAAILANDLEPLLRHARGAVHNQVGIRRRRMNLRDAIDVQNVARGLARELVGAVARADGDRQRIDLGPRHEILGLSRVGEHHVMRQRPFRTHAVLLARLPGFQRTEAAQLPLDRDPDAMRHLAYAERHLDAAIRALSLFRLPCTLMLFSLFAGSFPFSLTYPSIMTWVTREGRDCMH